MSDIPSGEDFAKAKRVMRERFRGLDVVEKSVSRHFRALCPFHSFVILPHENDSFEAYVFFQHEADVEACKRSGIVREIEDFVYKEIERAGRGNRDDITVRFEYDSDENVVANYDGDYFLRLR